MGVLSPTSFHQHIDGRKGTPSVMDKHRLSAIFFVSLMLISGCLSGAEPEPIIEEEVINTYEIKASWALAPATITMGEVATFLVNVERIGAGEFDVTPSVLSPTFSSVQELTWVQQTDGYKLSFPTESVGDYIIRLTFTNIGESSMVPEIESLVHLLEVIEPVEEAPIITAPARIVLEQPDVLWFEGSVEHDSPTTCLLTYTINDGTTGSLGLTPDFTWKKLMDFTDSTETLR